MGCLKNNGHGISCFYARDAQYWQSWNCDIYVCFFARTCVVPHRVDFLVSPPQLLFYWPQSKQHEFLEQFGVWHVFYGKLVQTFQLGLINHSSNVWFLRTVHDSLPLKSGKHTRSLRFPLFVHREIPVLSPCNAMPTCFPHISWSGIPFFGGLNPGWWFGT